MAPQAKEKVPLRAELFDRIGYTDCKSVKEFIGWQVCMSDQGRVSVHLLGCWSVVHPHRFCKRDSRC
ncbi:hypothetical protein GCM10027567_09180 [Spongiibacter taiwanensis]